MTNQIDSAVLIAGPELSGKTFLSYSLATKFINDLHIPFNKVNIIVRSLQTNTFWKQIMPNANIFDRTQELHYIQSSIINNQNELNNDQPDSLLILDDCIMEPNDEINYHILGNNQINASSPNRHIIVVCKDINYVDSYTLITINKYYVMKYNNQSMVSSIYNKIINNNQLNYNNFIDLYTASTNTTYSSLLIKNNTSSIQSYESFPSLFQYDLGLLPPIVFDQTQNNLTTTATDSLNSVFGNGTYTHDEVQTLLGNTIPGDLISDGKEYYHKFFNVESADDTVYYDNVPTSDEEDDTSPIDTNLLKNKISKLSVPTFPLSPQPLYTPKFKFSQYPLPVKLSKIPTSPIYKNITSNTNKNLFSSEYKLTPLKTKRIIKKLWGSDNFPITVVPSPIEFGISDLRVFSGTFVLRI